MFPRVYIIPKWMIDWDWQTLSLDLVELAMSVMLIKDTRSYASYLERVKLEK